MRTAALQLCGPAAELAVSASEAHLLEAFLKAPEHLLERRQVAMHLGMNTHAILASSLEVRVANLRRKLQVVCPGVTGENPLRAVRGIGYKLCVPVQME